jgi:1-acyl-sn-glycerol-3-phosphate acyltransferase
MLYIVLRLLSAFFLKLLFNMQVIGRQNVPEEGGFIIASNHVSYLDPIAVGVAVPRKINFMAKEELFCNSFAHWFMTSLHSFPVKRNSADLSAIKEALHRLKSGGGLVIFPEGSRRFDGLDSQAQAGVGFLAVKSGAPVVPAFIEGTDKALPNDKKFIRLHKISVYFGKPIYPKINMPYEEVAQEVLKSIMSLAPNSSKNS